MLRRRCIINQPIKQQSASCLYNFKFHYVLQNASQVTLFDTIAREIVGSDVDGINVGPFLRMGRLLKQRKRVVL